MFPFDDVLLKPEMEKLKKVAQLYKMMIKILLNHEYAV